MKKEDKIKEVQLTLDKVELESPRDYGDLIPIDEFIEACKSHAFINYDGSGEYATIDKVSKIHVRPSDILAGRIDRRFTHVMWYNR